MLRWTSIHSYSTGKAIQTSPWKGWAVSPFFPVSRRRAVSCKVSLAWRPQACERLEEMFNLSQAPAHRPQRLPQSRTALSRTLSAGGAAAVTRAGEGYNTAPLSSAATRKGAEPLALGPPPWPSARPPLSPASSSLQLCTLLSLAHLQSRPSAPPPRPSAPPSLALGPASSASAPPAQALRPASSAPHHTSQTSSSLPRRGLPGWLALAAALIPPLCGAPRPYRSRPPSSALPPLRRCAPPSLPGQAGVRPPRASLCRLSPPRAALRPGLLSPGPPLALRRRRPRPSQPPPQPGRAGPPPRAVHRDYEDGLRAQ